MRVASHFLSRPFMLSVALVSLFACFGYGADDPAETSAPTIAVETLLVSDAVPMALPAFHDAERAGVTWDDLLAKMPAVPGATWPAQDRTFAGLEGEASGWRQTDLRVGELTLSLPEQAAAHYLAFYVTTDRWQKLTLTVAGDHPVVGTVGGQALDFSESAGEEGSPASRAAEMKVTIGKHLIILRSMHHPGIEGDWTLNLGVTPGDAEAAVSLSVTPDHAVDIQTVLNAPRIGGVSISPDGKLVAVSLSEYRNGSDRESWLEVREVKSGKLERLWRGDHAPQGISWHPRGHRVAWRTNNDQKGTIRSFDFESGESEVLLADVENLGTWRWAPDGESVIYAVTRKPEPDPRSVKRLLYPADRRPWWRGRSHLYQVFVPTGVSRQLVAGPVSANGWEVSPDGRQMLFFTSDSDFTERPYNTSELWIMDMETLAVRKVLSERWIGAASWSPDGRQLLLRGGASAFDGLGRNLPEGVVPNDFCLQLYTYDLATETPTPISLNLRPDVEWSAWSPADGMIYARTTDTQYNTVWRLKPGTDDWQKVATGLDVTRQFVLARAARVAVLHGSGATTPNQVQVVNLKNNKSRLLLDPGSAWYRDVVFGRIENWVAELDKGMEMDGYIYYPPGFDPERKYPVIVYYYGGTSPITRDFGGRYPKNIWAGQDYVVYVPNPSGATGYGQEFAARHVNDWGVLTAPEVIEGTRKFLAAHEFADASRVGCMGASYGGFLTEYIVTQTDLFAAAVSHAGISDITSYWGEGFWGYDYGSVALADRFPWSDRKFYLDQSPLFQADKITTPLLLVHGDDDTNVPKGESVQLYTALKLLGREVEYVQVVGQDHHILDHEKRIVWNDTILAFLAKYLKDRPAWWDEMYPEPEDYR